MNLSTFQACTFATLVLLGASAHAESRPYYLGLTETVTHDNYMQRYGGTGADWISSTGVRLGVDKAYGRQQFVVDASVSHNEYRRNDVLNNDEYVVGARWNWATVNRLSGVLSAQSSQSLYKNTLTTQFLGRNLLRSEDINFQAQVGLVTRWSADAGWSASRQSTSNSAAVFDSLNTRQHSLSAGLRWSPSTDVSARLGGRQSRGTLPNLGDDFVRDDLDFNATYTPSGTSALNARLSKTRVEHSLAGLTDLDAWTGLLGWTWQVSGKTRLSLTASRDSSLGAVDQSGALRSFSASNALLSNTIGLSGGFDLTGKLSADARLSRTRRTIDNNSTTTLGGGVLVLPSQASGKDTLLTASLNLRYVPTRFLELGCGYALEDHTVDANNNQGIGVPPYTARVYNCYGQLFIH